MDKDFATNTQKLLRRLILLLLATSYSLLIVGCGFHLKGSANLPASMEKTYIKGQSSTILLRNLRASLKASGVNVVDTVKDATAILDINRETEDRRVLSVSSAAKVSEYELSYAVTFSVYRKDGAVIVPAQTIRQTRDYNFDENAVLSKSDEESLLRKEMKRDAVSSIMRRIEARGR
jgi:LPS-assembly lipoprotein